MIYTVTFNPAIDYVIYADEIKSGEVNRSNREEVYFGGKGVNVSTVLSRLKTDNCALGFICGFTGKAIESGLNKIGVKTDFIELKDGLSRINVKLKADTETDINAQGPNIDAASIERLILKLDKLNSGDFLVLAGSIPKSLPSDIYEKILKRLDGRGIYVVADATGDLLLNVLKYRPFLVKPNNHELDEMLGTRSKSLDDIISGARRLKSLGAFNVLVSLAGDGSVLVTENDEVIRMGVPKGKAVNSVGAGDSMVAGFIAGYLKHGDYREALRLGTACGSATAFSPGLAEADTIEKMLSRI